MSLLENEFARRDPQGVELRPTPARLAWRLDALSSSDDHELRVRFVASAQVAEDPTDRRLFAETLLTRIGPLTLDEVSEHFRAALTSAARDTLREKIAKDWLQPENDSVLCESMRKTLERVGFSCGLQILPPFVCEIRSPSFERAQRVAQHAAVQSQSLARARDLLQQFNELRNASPDRSAGQLLSHLLPAEQSEMLTALLAAGSETKSTQQLFAVSGTTLLRIDPRTSSSPETILTSDAIGPFRSISVDGDRLLIGGQRGVLEVDLPSRTLKRVFTANVQSDFGFNAAVEVAGKLFATHVEAGLLVWDSSDTPARELFRSFTPATTEWRGTAGASVAMSNASLGSGGGVIGPRNLVHLADRTLLFSVGAKLFQLDGDRVTELAQESSADVISLLPADERVLIVRRTGTIESLDKDTNELSQLATLRRDLRAAGLLPWMSSYRLLIADNLGSIDCVGLEDSGVVRFQSPNLEMRMLAACDDRIAGVASDRQRIQIWSLSNSESPLREVHIAALTRHRIAAIRFA